MTFSGAVLVALVLQDPQGVPWKRHVIDASSRGADGIRLADLNQDGRPELVTGWEEGGITRVYLHPEPSKAKTPWPAVTVAQTTSVEDAVFVDLDGDGALDVVSSCEGSAKSHVVSWNPRDSSKLLEPSAWKQEVIPATRGMTQWMFALPHQVDGKGGVDLICGGKNKDARIGWLEAPASPRRLEDWKWHTLREAGWIMSLVAADMDGDGDLDLLFTDRKGGRSGCFWLDSPSWTEHAVGGVGQEVMFLTLADLDQDGLEDVLVATKPAEILFLRRRQADGKSWETRRIPFPKGTGTAKGVGAGDLDGDGHPDLVFSCEQAEGDKSGVRWMKAGAWEGREISGPEGVKFDQVVLRDVDGDGDLDVLTCEEVANLGVIWFENPLRP